MAVCPVGHESEWNDYCSICGVSMSDPAASAPAAGDPDAQDPDEQERSKRAAELAGKAQPCCPNCDQAHAADDVFCENCGYDFLTGTMPGEEVLASPRSALAGSEVPATVAVISIDLAFFSRMGFEGVDPPAQMPEAVRIELPPTDILVGRHSESRGKFPEIDLSSVFTGDATDPAVSSSHCRLHRGAHGWTVTDLDSTNGTFIAESDEALTPGVPVSLTPGTPVFVGAWTRIDLEDA